MSEASTHVLDDNGIPIDLAANGSGHAKGGTSNNVDASYYRGFEFASGGTEYNIYFDKGLNIVGVSAGDNVATAVASSDAPCYCPGTLILTERGEVPVEDLRIGDTLITASDQHRPIKWLGRRSYARRFLAANPGVQPIRFHAVLREAAFSVAICSPPPARDVPGRRADLGRAVGERHHHRPRTAQPSIETICGRRTD